MVYLCQYYININAWRLHHLYTLCCLFKGQITGQYIDFDMNLALKSTPQKPFLMVCGIDANTQLPGLSEIK